MAYGRELKGTSRRVPITVHALLDRLDMIDEYVEESNQNDVYQNCTENFERQKNLK